MKRSVTGVALQGDVISKRLLLEVFSMGYGCWDENPVFYWVMFTFFVVLSVVLIITNCDTGIIDPESAWSRCAAKQSEEQSQCISSNKKNE